MGFGEYIFKVIWYSLFGGYFLGSSAKNFDEKNYFMYGLDLMLTIPFIVKVAVMCIEFFK